MFGALIVNEMSQEQQKRFNCQMHCLWFGEGKHIDINLKTEKFYIGFNLVK